MRGGTGSRRNISCCSLTRESANRLMRKGITRLSKLPSKHAGQTDISVSLTARIDSSFCAPRYVRHRVDINLVIFHFLYRINSTHTALLFCRKPYKCSESWLTYRIVFCQISSSRMRQTAQKPKICTPHYPRQLFLQDNRLGGLSLSLTMVFESIILILYS
jgi:hypothetical protein